MSPHLGCFTIRQSYFLVIFKTSVVPSRVKEKRRAGPAYPHIRCTKQHKRAAKE